MLAQFELMEHLYSNNFTLEKHEAYLTEMLPHNYKQITLFEGDVCIVLSGLWSGIKI